MGEGESCVGFMYTCKKMCVRVCVRITTKLQRCIEAMLVQPKCREEKEAVSSDKEFGVCVRFFSFWEASSAPREHFSTAAAKEMIRGWPLSPHTRSRILTLPHQGSHHVSAQSHTHMKPHNSCCFIVYKPEWVLIVLNRAFTTQMLFLGLRVHPHMFSPMVCIHKQH